MHLLELIFDPKNLEGNTISKISFDIFLFLRLKESRMS